MRVPIDLPAGIVGDDTTFAAQARWADGSNMRFRLGRAETIGGWESLTTTLLTGACRNIFPFTDNADNLTIGFGTHSSLQLWQGGGLYDITPTLALPAKTLGANPLAVTNGSAVVTVTHNGHGLVSTESAVVSGALSVGRITPNGTFTLTVLDANSYTLTFGSAAAVAKTLASGPLSVVSGSPVVTVSETAHNIADGTVVTISGAAAVGGITPNGAFAISVIDANSYKYTFTSNATSSTSGGGASVVATVPTTGGGSAVVITPQRAYSAGQIDGTGSSGFGTGAFGVGGFGLPSTADYFPRTWALGAWGQNLLAAPRGGTIYAWSNNTAAVAAPLANAPAQVNHMVVAPNDGGYQVFALGCNQETSGIFNPMCVRHSSIRIDTEWTTDVGTTAREYVLTGGGRIVAGRMCGPFLLIWTNDSLFLGEFIGNLEQPWKFTRVAKNCGLIGPNAAVVHGQQAFWASPDRQFYSYRLGGQPEPIPCPIRQDYAENLAPSQGDKVVASSIAEFSEVRFDYPDQRDGTGIENSRYLALSIAPPDAGSWYRGTMGRTAMVDAGPAQYPIAATLAGNVYFHEKGHSADGGVLDWFIETADQYLNENFVMYAGAIWPDIFHQQGPVNITVYSRFYPQDTEVSSGPLVMWVGAQKVDFRQSGRLFRFRLAGSSAPSFARLGKFDVDAVRGGLR